MTGPPADALRRVPHPVARSVGDAVVTPHELAGAAALEILAAGGNAVDAAVAANAVQGVVAPETCGIGGDLFALVHRPGMDRPWALNASGRAGSGVDADRLRATDEDLPWDHPFTVTAPGTVDGWSRLLDEYGTLDLATVLAPAIRHAEEGFPVSAELARALERRADTLGTEPGAAELYPGGRPPAVGARLRRPALAATLRRIADRRRDGFYTGPVAEAIVDRLTEAAGAPVLTADDLARSHAEVVEPIAAEVFGRTAWTVPPNSQGYLTLAAAWILERLDAPTDPFDPLYHHLLVEAYRAVAWERDDLVADPERVPLAPEALLDPEQLAPLAERIDPLRSVDWPPPRPTPGGTAYLCVVDRTGIGVSLIQSNYMGIGTNLAVPGHGFVLHNRGAGFTLRPGHPNELAPGRRPLHTLSPTLWTRDGALSLLLGTRGGSHQPQLLLQVAAHRFHAGLDPAAAQAFPRWEIHEFGPGAPSHLEVESRLPGRIVDGLRRRGHAVTAAAPFMGGWGPVGYIEIDGDLRIAVHDPRVETARAHVR